jgi:hypothetical protein
MIVAYGVTLVMSILATFTFIVGVAAANGAPQEASASAIALAMVVIPYVFSRCLEKMSQERKNQAERIKAILATKDRVQESAAADVARGLQDCRVMTR